MKGAAEFCPAWMVKDKQVYFITSHSTSSEAQYVTPDGFIGATLYGGTSDIAMIRECLDQTIKASQILNVDADFRDNMEKVLNQLYPLFLNRFN
jgi:alpha-L-fucosidase 2